MALAKREEIDVATKLRIVEIDRALFQVDDRAKTYWYYSRNFGRACANAHENEVNKRSLTGYARLFKNGTKKLFGLA